MVSFFYRIVRLIFMTFLLGMVAAFLLLTGGCGYMYYRYGHDLPDDYFRNVGRPVNWKLLGTGRFQLPHIEILDRPKPAYDGPYTSNPLWAETSNNIRLGFQPKLLVHIGAAHFAKRIALGTT